MTPTAPNQPPHSPESEMGALGCCLLDPQTCIGEAAQRLTSAADFYDLRHQVIWDTMLAMWHEREQIDLITLQAALKARKMLDQVGGIAYLNELQDAVPSAANLPTYLSEVVEKAMLREMEKVCHQGLLREVV